MAYVPVDKRGGTATSAYTPVAARTTSTTAAAPVKAPSPGSVTAPGPVDVFGGLANSTPSLLQTPAPNFQTLTGENVYTPAVGGDIAKGLGTPTPPKPKPSFVADTTLSNATPSAEQRIVSAIPEKWRAPIESIVEDIRTGLVGNERDKAFAQDEGTEPTHGLVGFLLPFAGRSETDKMEARSQALERAGVAPDRAAQIAFYDVLSGLPSLPGSSTTKVAADAASRLAALNPTDEEKKALYWSDIGQKVGTSLDLLGVLPVGAIARTASLTKALKSLPATAEGIQEAERLLVNAGVDESIAKNAAEKFASLTDEKAINEGLDAIERLQNTTKAYTPVETRAASKPIVKPTTPEQAAADYYTRVIAPANDAGKATVISADNIKDLYKDYNDSNHSTYSKAAFQLYENALKENPNPDVIFTAGGPGSGKTELLVRSMDQHGFDGIIYDSNMSSVEGAKRQIEAARKAGKNIIVTALLPDLEKSRGFTLVREAKTGRGISDETFARNHAAVPNTLRALLEDGTLKPEEVHLFDMRDGPTKAEALQRVHEGDFVEDPLATLQNVRYDEDNLRGLYGGKKETQISGRDTEEPGIRPILHQGSDRDRAVAGRGEDGRGVNGGDYEGTQGQGGQKSAAGIIPKELEPLAVEAQKYKSAEEFVKAQTFYRGEGSGKGGNYFTKDQEFANEFNSRHSYNPDKLTQAIIPDSKIYRAKVLPEAVNEAQVTKAISEAKKQGLSAIYVDEGTPFGEPIESIFVFDKSAIQTKSQLTDFYNIATKAEKTGAALPQTAAEAITERAAYATRNETRVAGKAERESSVRALLDGKSVEQAKQELEYATTGRDIYRDTAENMPGKALQKYESQATGELPEVTGKAEVKSISGSGKTVKNSKFGQEGDKIVQEMGFESPEAAQQALTDYKEMRAQVKEAENSVRAKVKNYRDRKAVFDEVMRYVNAQARARREKIAAVQEFFVMTDADMKGLLKGERDIRLMSDGEFNDFMKRLDGKATEQYLRSQTIMELQSTIFEKELKKVENLYKALKFPKLENMSIGQVKKLNEFMDRFKQGDEFLGRRQLETIKNTDLKGIYTRREAQEKLLAQVNREREAEGKPPASLEDLQNIKVSELDRYRYDTALARQNPLYGLMVQEKNKAFLEAELNVFDARERVNELFKAARNSRAQTLLDRAIPMDLQIFHWLESSDAEKIKMAQHMTEEELEAASYIRGSYAEMRDYLVEQQTLKKFVKDYVTHVRRGFLEAWREEGSYTKGIISGEKAGPLARAGKGFMAAMKDTFKQYLQEEAYFNILDQQTDTILPLEKFFQFSMKRSGELVPSKNVAKAFLQYLSTFEKKKALDAIVPKLDIYVHSLTPSKLTPKGLEFDSSLKRFFKEWLNSKKGRVTDRALVKPGGKIDWALRTGVAFTRLVDLGFSLPVGIASNLGAQAAVYRGLGEVGYAKGLARLASPQGRTIIRKYRAFTGEPVLQKAFSAEGTLGESLLNGIFGLFSFADRQARQTYLLGKMTPEEFAKGSLSTDKLARMQTDLGRHLPIEGFESIIGKTALGKVGSQYKSWAVPLLSSTLDDLGKLGVALKEGDASYLKSPEFAELLRTTVVSAAVGLGGYGILSDKTPSKDQTFAEKLAHKAANDALSLIGALDPTLWSSVRLLSFIADLSKSIKQIVLVQDAATGAKGLANTLIPAAVKQVIPPTTTKSSNLKLPPLPKLKAPAFPKLPGGKLKGPSFPKI